MQYVLENFMMSAPTNLCRIVSYDLDPATDQTGITQTATGCNTIDCRTLTFDTSFESVYVFKFVITSNAQLGYQKLTTQVLTTKIICGAEVQSVSETSRTLSVNKNSGIQTIDFEKDGIRQIFSSNIQACDITRFDLFQEDNQSVEMLKKNKTDETSIQILTQESFRSKVHVYSYV